MSSSGQSVEGSFIGGSNIQIGSVAGDVTIVMDQPDYRLERWAPTDRPQKVPRWQRRPSFLLDARREVVPFHPRQEEERQLRSWCADFEEPFSVMLVHGAGGQGKTRLARHFASCAHVDGWAVVQAVEESLPERSGAHEVAALGRDQPLLVVVDYAERWHFPILLRLIERMPYGAPDSRVRLLLLARDGTDLWETLRAETGRGSADLAPPLALGEFATDLADRQGAFAEAAEAFRAQLGLEPRSAATLPDLADSSYGSPLTLHMVALAAVCAEKDGMVTPEKNEVSGYLLDHERRYWASAGLLPKVIEKTVLVATLFGPLASASAARSLLRWAHIAGDDADAEEILDAYDRLYPPTADRLAGDGAGLSPGMLTPLHPDRFGEDFVAEYLRRPRVGELVVELVSASGLDPQAMRRCLTVLTAAAARSPGVRSVLFEILNACPDLSGHTTAPLLRLVTEHADRQLAEKVYDRLSDVGAELLRPACELAQHLLDTLPAGAPPADRLHWLYSVGGRMAKLGDPSAALSATGEAISICRILAEDDPATYLPNLARLLANSGLHKAEIGDAHGAVEVSWEAIRILGSLMKKDRDLHIPAFAAVLNNFSIQLAAVGNARGALNAVQAALRVYQQLEDPIHAPELARTLATLAPRLDALGDVEGALQAARGACNLYRRLVEADPGSYRPYLAISLNNLSSALGGAGITEESVEVAWESVRIHGELAAAEPDAYLPGLALSLSTLGVQAGMQGKTAVALEATRQAVEYYRELVQNGRAGQLPELARALGGYAAVRAVWRIELSDALEASFEAIEILERLAAEISQEYLARVDQIRDTAAMVLDALGRADEASAMRDHAAGIDGLSETI